MAGKRYDVSTPRPKADGGTFWLRVGSAFTNENGLITVFLDSYPVPGPDGKVKMMLFEPRDQQPNQQAPAQNRMNTPREVLDDDIPF